MNEVIFPTMLSLKEASQATGLSYSTLRKACHSGKIRYVKAGKRWLINQNSLIRYLEEGEK